MSVENAAKFIKKVSEDEAIYLEVKKLESRELEGLLKVAAKAGFSFSAEDWDTALASVNGELGDKDLDQVAGGTTYSLNYSSIQLSPVLSSFSTSGIAAGCKVVCTQVLDPWGGR